MLRGSLFAVLLCAPLQGAIASQSNSTPAEPDTVNYVDSVRLLEGDPPVRFRASMGNGSSLRSRAISTFQQQLSSVEAAVNDSQNIFFPVLPKRSLHMKNSTILPFAAAAALLVVLPLSPLGAASPSKWVERRSSNFIVVSNPVEGRVRKTALRVDAADSRVQKDVNHLMDYLCRTREYDARNLSAGDATAATAEQSGAVPKSAAQPGTASGQHASGNASATASPKVELLPQDLRADGVVTRVLCRGNAMQVTIARAKPQSPVTLHATERTKVDYTSDVPIKSGDIEPCTELKGHTVHIVYGAPKTKGAQGEIARIRVEK